MGRKSDTIVKGVFSDSLKVPNITSVHKTNSEIDKENYRSVSALSLLPD